MDIATFVFELTTWLWTESRKAEKEKNIPKLKIIEATLKKMETLLEKSTEEVKPK